MFGLACRWYSAVLNDKSEPTADSLNPHSGKIWENHNKCTGSVASYRWAPLPAYEGLCRD